MLFRLGDLVKLFTLSILLEYLLVEYFLYRDIDLSRMVLLLHLAMAYPFCEE
jgi:hypothetical protein